MKISTTSPYKSLTDPELIAAIYGADEKALNYLIEKHYNLLRRFLQKRMGTYKNSVNDVVQEVCILVVQALKKQMYRQESAAHYSTWLCAIAKNHLINFHRKEQREKRLHLDDSLSEVNDSSTFIDFVTGGTPHADSRLLAKEQSAVILKCIEKLPTERQVVMRMYFIDGKLIREICAETGIPEGTVKGHHFRSKQVLRSDPELRAIAYA